MIWLLLVIGIGAAVYFLFIRKTAVASHNTVTFNGVKCSRETHQTTPKGVHVWSVAGLPSSSLMIIDDSLTTLFMDCIAEGYKDRILDYDWINIYIPVNPCVPSPEQHAPCFKVVGGTGYDGTSWDQDPRLGFQTILATEMVINLGNNGVAEYIVCPDIETLANATRYGMEHILLNANSPDYFARSQVHTTIMHPLIPQNGR